MNIGLRQPCREPPRRWLSHPSSLVLNCKVCDEKNIQLNRTNYTRTAASYAQDVRKERGQFLASLQHIHVSTATIHVYEVYFSSQITLSWWEWDRSLGKNTSKNTSWPPIYVTMLPWQSSALNWWQQVWHLRLCPTKAWLSSASLPT